MRKAVYAGSFDPPTLGHEEVIAFGSRQFDELVVAIGINPAKSPLFSLAERVAMLEMIAAQFTNVKVATFENEFLIHYAQEVGANAILRGMRNADDFLQEGVMRQINADIDVSVDTVFCIPPRELVEVSSSFVKGLVGPQLWEGVVAPYVSNVVLEALKQKHAQK